MRRGQGGLNSIWRWYWRSNLGVEERIPRSVGLAEVKVSHEVGDALAPRAAA
jgi:hypothetical protein